MDLLDTYHFLYMIILYRARQQRGRGRVLAPVGHAGHLAHVGQVLQNVHDLGALGPVVGQFGFEIVEPGARFLAFGRLVDGKEDLAHQCTAKTVAGEQTPAQLAGALETGLIGTRVGQQIGVVRRAKAARQFLVDAAAIFGVALHLDAFEIEALQRRQGLPQFRLKAPGDQMVAGDLDGVADQLFHRAGFALAVAHARSPWPGRSRRWAAR